MVSLVNANANNPAEKIILFPISRGKNFGYGEAQGSYANQLIVDMSRMNSIVAINEKLGYVTIQPGVSQQQLSSYLKEKNIQLQLDVTGAGFDASIVGNILERGFGHTDYGDRFSRIIKLEVILGNGNLITTGLAANADASNSYRYGIGPIIDGLFSQSNFGIVTEMTIELMPRPQKTLMFVLSTKNENDLEGIVSAVRELKLLGIVQSAMHIANKSRAVGDEENNLAGVWNMSGNITGPAELVSVKKRIIRKIFSKYIKNFRLIFLGRNMLGMMEWFHKNIMKLQFFPTLKDIYDLQDGIPTEGPLRTLLNDSNLHSASLSARNYNQCFYWINAVLMSDENSVRKAINLLQHIFKEWNYEFRVTLTAVNPRTLILISNIAFPKTDVEIEKANRFSKLCHEKLQSEGFYPYRSGSGMYDKIPAYDAAYAALLKELKQVFDPNNIIAPGKYNI